MVTDLRGQRGEDVGVAQEAMDHSVSALRKELENQRRAWLEKATEFRTNREQCLNQAEHWGKMEEVIRAYLSGESNPVKEVDRF